MINSERSKKRVDNEYNKEPIFYCKNCLSLKIRHIPNIQDTEYCDDCGSTNIEKTSIQEWEKIYVDKFGHNYLEEY